MTGLTVIIVSAFHHHMADRLKCGRGSENNILPPNQFKVFRSQQGVDFNTPKTSAARQGFCCVARVPPSIQWARLFFFSRNKFWV